MSANIGLSQHRHPPLTPDEGNSSSRPFQELSLSRRNQLGLLIDIATLCRLGSPAAYGLLRYHARFPGRLARSLAARPFLRGSSAESLQVRPFPRPSRSSPRSLDRPDLMVDWSRVSARQLAYRNRPVVTYPVSPPSHTGRLWATDTTVYLQTIRRSRSVCTDFDSSQ